MLGVSATACSGSAEVCVMVPGSIRTAGFLQQRRLQSWHAALSLTRMPQKLKKIRVNSVISRYLQADLVG